MFKNFSFTKWVSLGWWASFAFFVTQSAIIEIFAFSATPWLGFFLFAAATILTFSPHYDKSYRFSPYRGFLKMLNREKK